MIKEVRCTKCGKLILRLKFQGKIIINVKCSRCRSVLEYKFANEEVK